MNRIPKLHPKGEYPPKWPILAVLTTFHRKHDNFLIQTKMNRAEQKKTKIDWSDPEQVKEYQRAYRQKNHKRIARVKQLWQVRNKEKQLEYTRRFRLRKAGLSPMAKPGAEKFGIPRGFRPIHLGSMSDIAQTADIIEADKRTRYDRYRASYINAQRKFRQKHKEKIWKRKQAYRKAHLELFARKMREYRARKKQEKMRQRESTTQQDSSSTAESHQSSPVDSSSSSERHK